MTAVSPATIVIACGLLGAATYLVRLAGVMGAHRLRVGPRARTLLTEASVVLLVALAVTGTFTAGRGWAPPSRWAGVAVGTVLAALKVPFVVVVLAAATVSALLRLAGLP